MSVEMIACACGCGETRTSLDVRGRPRIWINGHCNRKVGPVLSDGYVVIKDNSHPRPKSKGYVYEHILIAEKALGHYLPEGAQVHHVDGIGSNNANQNLVICQDLAYHKLLHARARVIRAGGNFDTDKLCPDCSKVKPKTEFHRSTLGHSGRATYCRDCSRLRQQLRKEKRNDRTA